MLVIELKLLPMLELMLELRPMPGLQPMPFILKPKLLVVTSVASFLPALML